MASTSYAADTAFAHELERVLPNLLLSETEDTWQKIEKSITRIDALTKAGAYKDERYVVLLKDKGVAQAITLALLSERTRLSGAAADLITSAAPRLGHRFDALVSSFVPPLLLCCARTNKVALARAKKCLLLIARYCKLVSLLNYTRDAATDKSVTLRLAALEIVVCLLTQWQAQEQEERDPGILGKAAEIEGIIRTSARDCDSEARQLSKQIYDIYSKTWPERVDAFVAPLTPTTRRYLALASKIGGGGSRPPSRQQGQRQPLGAISLPQTRTAASTTATVKTAGQHAQRSQAALRAPVSRVASGGSGGSSGRARAQAAQSSDSASREADRAEDVSSESAKEPRQMRKASREELASILPYEEEAIQRSCKQHDESIPTSSTPSRAIAARLAREQTRRQIGPHIPSSTSTTRTATSSSRAAMTAFAVAASKKHSPRRMPVRVPLAQAHQKIPPVRANTVASSRNQEPARVAADTEQSNSAPSAASQDSDDVFDSRPISASLSHASSVPASTAAEHVAVDTPASTPMPTSLSASPRRKPVSTLTRSLGARDVSLGRSNASLDAAARSSPTVHSQRTTLEQKRAALARRDAIGVPQSPLKTAMVAGSPAMLEQASPSDMSSRTSASLPTPSCATEGRHHSNDTLQIARVVPLPLSSSSPTSGSASHSSSVQGMHAPLSPHVSAATAALRSPPAPSAMLRQMALTMLSRTPQSSSSPSASEGGGPVVPDTYRPNVLPVAPRLRAQPLRTGAAVLQRGRKM